MKLRMNRGHPLMSGEPAKYTGTERLSKRYFQRRTTFVTHLQHHQAGRSPQGICRSHPRRDREGRIQDRCHQKDFHFEAASRGLLRASTARGPSSIRLTTFMSSGAIIPLVLEKENAILDLRKLMGATNPAQCRRGHDPEAVCRRRSKRTRSTAPMPRTRLRLRLATSLLAMSWFNFQGLEFR